MSSEKSGRTLEQVKSVAVSDVKLAYPVSLDERYITSLKNIEQFELDNDIITSQVDFDYGLIPPIWKRQCRTIRETHSREDT